MIIIRDKILFKKFNITTFSPLKNVTTFPWLHLNLAPVVNLKEIDYHLARVFVSFFYGPCWALPSLFLYIKKIIDNSWVILWLLIFVTLINHNITSGFLLSLL